MEFQAQDGFVVLEVVAEVHHLDGRLIASLSDASLEDASRLATHDRKRMFDSRSSSGDLVVLRFLRFIEDASAHAFLNDHVVHLLRCHFRPHRLAAVGTIAEHDHVARVCTNPSTT